MAGTTKPTWSKQAYKQSQRTVRNTGMNYNTRCDHKQTKDKLVLQGRRNDRAWFGYTNACILCGKVVKTPVVEDKHVGVFLKYKESYWRNTMDDRYGW